MDSSSQEMTVQRLDANCYLLRKALDFECQIALFEDIQAKDRQFSSSQQQQPKAALYPSPRTVRLGDQKTKLKWAAEPPPTIYSELVDRANDAIKEASTTTDSNLDDYKSITLSAIEYQADKHTLAEHIDHDDSFVYLLSLGCTTNFVLNGPNMASPTTTALRSGDLIVFDASTKGQILHGITNIEDDTCPVELARRFPILHNHRYGIQLRVRF